GIGGVAGIVWVGGWIVRGRIAIRSRTIARRVMVGSGHVRACGRGGGAAALIGLAVLVMVPKVVFVGVIEIGAATDDEQIFGVGLLGAFREIEAAGDDRLVIDEHHLVVGNGVGRVDQRGNARVGNEIGPGVLLGLLTLVENDIDGNAAVVSFDESVSDRHRGE